MLTSEAPKTLHDARERAGMSRREVSERTKANGFYVSEGAIFDLEKGERRTPYKRTIYALCDVYGIDPDPLFVTAKESA